MEKENKKNHSHIHQIVTGNEACHDLVIVLIHHHHHKHYPQPHRLSHKLKEKSNLTNI